MCPLKLAGLLSARLSFLSCVKGAFKNVLADKVAIIHTGLRVKTRLL